MTRASFTQLVVALLSVLSVLAPTAEAADAPTALATTLPPVHLVPLALDVGGATPWEFSPLWFAQLAVVLPAILWAGLALSRALDEDPHRLRRAGKRELRRVLARLERVGGVPQAVDLHAWLQSAARTWGVRVSAPTGGEVALSMSALDNDAATQARWQELWNSAERALYSAASTLSPSWVQEAAMVSSQVRIPPRKHWLPTRPRHWLPSRTAALCLCMLLACLCNGLRATEDAATQTSPGPEENAKPAFAPDTRVALALRSAQGPASSVLRVNWNNWAAHYNVAAQQMIQGNVDYAVAHLTAAFLQHPASDAVRDNLRWSLQQTGSMDPTLRRLLYGAWFQRYPALLSPAGWQRLGLIACLLIGAGLCARVLEIYVTRREHELRLICRAAVTAGIFSLGLSVMAWNAWGDLHRPNVAMLVEDINLSPAPTDLVKDRETLPMMAGTLALTHATFLSWKQVQCPGFPGRNVSGWLRSPYVMPLYDTR